MQTAANATLSHLQTRYTKILTMQANDPDRFKPAHLGPRFLIRDERYNQLLRYLRLRMSALWEPNDAHRVHMQERLATLAEHALRERAFAAAMTRFPLLGNERLLWNKIDNAHSLIREALDMVRSADRAVPFEDAA